jgi:hypothetical protein
MPATSSADAIRQRYREYVRSEPFNADFAMMHATCGLVCLGVAFFLVTFKPRMAWGAWRGSARRGCASGKLRNEYVRLADVGVPIVTYAAMYNSGLRDAPGQFAPAMLVGSFDEKITEEQLRGYALDASAVSIMADTPEEEELARVLKDEDVQLRRRRKFPLKMTGNREVFAFDALISGHHLPSGKLEVPRIVCLADPNPRGLIAAVPIE